MGLQSSRMFKRRVDGPAIVAGAVLCTVLAGGLLAGHLAPHAYQHFDLDAIHHPPTLANNYFFGTDSVGHDVLSRTLFAIRTSILIGFEVAACATAIGLIVGGIAGYFGGSVDAVCMWFVDFVNVIPALGVLLAGLVLVGQAARPHWVSIALILYLWGRVARVVRGAVVSLRHQEFEEAARAAGASDARIFMRHLLPNCLGPIIVSSTALISQTILIEATVEFLGFGFDPWVTPSLGGLIGEAVSNDGGVDIFQFWWVWTVPALVLIAVLTSINLLGDWLDDSADPLRRRPLL
jgi:ABC-type dipeptide/oligopeptide/nickel transport system permease subunit